MTYLERDGTQAARTLSSDAERAEKQELFGIRELAEEFGISARTIRFYESKELLSPTRVNGARVYTRRDRARLALILRAKAIGSSLREIRQYLDFYGEHGEGREKQLEFVVQRTGETIVQLEARRTHIDATLEQLRLIHRESRKQLEALRARSEE